MTRRFEDGRVPKSASCAGLLIVGGGLAGCAAEGRGAVASASLEAEATVSRKGTGQPTDTALHAAATALYSVLPAP